MRHGWLDLRARGVEVLAMKTILVPIPDTAVNEAAMATALMVAKALAGHLEGLYIESPPSASRTVPMQGYEVPSYGRAAMAEAGAAHHLREAEEREREATRARSEFQRLCHAHEVPVVAPDAFETRPSACWQQTQGSHAGAVTARAPAHDLMVVPNASVAVPALEIAEHVLLETGRPVLLSPARADRDPSASAMIAWYPSLQAWRAVAAAVPLMARARRVEVITVGAEDEPVVESRAEVIRYLGWHGIRASARHLPPISRSIGDRLLSEAGEAEAGMLVMGAYSHSRLRELLLGGVTRHVLTNAAATPVFMAH
jgi:nucleotide-binding universal stress UspA family protein